MATASSAEFDGFLSYSHADSSEMAADVQRVLHAIARPWYKLRAVRVFRDGSNIIPSESLQATIEQALAGSRHFLLLLSPGAAQSPWVDRELAWWLANRGTSHLILIVTAGKLVWQAQASDFDWEGNALLPPSLRGAFREEPLWINLPSTEGLGRRAQRERMRATLLPVAARLHGKSPDAIGGEDVQRRRTAYGVAAVAAATTVALTSFGLYSARASALKAEAAQSVAQAQSARAESEAKRAQEQAARAEGERLDRIANLALRSVADEGVSAEAVAQLGHVARDRPGAEGDASREVLGYWLQALAPLGTLLHDGQVVNWRDRALLMVDGRVVRLAGGRKAWAAWSRVPRRLYAVDEAAGQLGLFDARDGKQLAVFDISDLVADQLRLHEQVDGDLLLIEGVLQSASAGGADPRVGFASVGKDSSVRWFEPMGLDDAVRVAEGCRYFEIDQHDEGFAVRVDPGAVTRVTPLAGHAPSMAKLMPLEQACAARRLSPIEGLDKEFAFPITLDEARRWTQSPTPAASSASSEGPSAPSATERAALLPAMQRSRDRLDQLVERARAQDETALDAAVMESVRFEMMLDQVEQGGPVTQVLTPAGMVLLSTASAGAQHGETSLCRLPKADELPTCAVYNFHGNFGQEAWSTTGRYVAVHDMAFAGHRSVGLLDLHAAKAIDLPSTPTGIAVATAFAHDDGMLAVLSDRGEVSIYKLAPRLALLRKARADVRRALKDDFPDPEQAPCLQLRGNALLYCNAKGGLTALSTSTGEILWTTPRIAAEGQRLNLVVGNGPVAVLHTPGQLRLFRLDDGAMLTGPVSTAMLSPGQSIDEVRVSAHGEILVRLGGQWKRRAPPLKATAVRQVLDSLPCWTGLAAGPAMNNAETLACSRPSDPLK